MVQMRRDDLDLKDPRLDKLPEKWGGGLGDAPHNWISTFVHEEFRRFGPAVDILDVGIEGPFRFVEDPVMVARKKRKAKRSTNRRSAEQRRKEPEETRGAEFVTVAWMLSTLVTLAALVVAGAGWLLILLIVDADEITRQTVLLPALLLYLALITGIVCLILSPLAHRVRRVPPPRSVTIVAAVVGTAPLVALLLISLLS